MIDTNELCAALGVDPNEIEKSGSENSQQPAPAGQHDTPAEGENDQSVPASDTSAEADQSGETHADDEQGQQQGGKAPQTKEERAQHAAERRAREQQAAIDKAVQEAIQNERSKNQADQEAFFRTAGLVNSATGQPIKTMDDFEKWHTDYERDKLAQDMQNGLTPELLDQAIAANPIVQAAQQLLKASGISPAGSPAQAEQQPGGDTAAFAQRVDTELAAIRARGDTGVQSVQDLFRLPEWPQINQLVRDNGLTFDQAHQLATQPRLSTGKAERAAAAAAAAGRGKSHLQTVGGAVGVGSDPIPPQVMRDIKAMWPDASASEIQAWYDKLKH